MASTTIVPKLLPIAGTWAAPFSLYYVLLSSRVLAQRMKTDVYFGSEDKKSTATPSKTESGNPVPTDLEVASRCQVNFIENVPLAFVLLTIAELNGGSRKTLHYTMATLFALRIAHSELGLRLRGTFGDSGVGRPIGYFGSLGVLAGLGVYSAALVKGYWGL